MPKRFKLTAEQIQEIKDSKFDNTLTQQEKAKKYGVSQALINFYYNGRRKEKPVPEDCFDIKEYSKQNKY